METNNIIGPYVVSIDMHRIGDNYCGHMEDNTGNITDITNNPDDSNNPNNPNGPNISEQNLFCINDYDVRAMRDMCIRDRKSVV